MTQITARVPNEVVEELDEEAEKRDETRADRLRNIISSRHESDRLRSKVEELQSEVEKIVKKSVGFRMRSHNIRTKSRIFEKIASDSNLKYLTSKPRYSG